MTVVTVMVPADSLQPGDSIVMYDTPCTVLADHEPCKDMFGRDMFRYWCRRDDTEAEGWLMFGPGGVVRKAAQ